MLQRTVLLALALAIGLVVSAPPPTVVVPNPVTDDGQRAIDRYADRQAVSGTATTNQQQLGGYPGVPANWLNGEEEGEGGGPEEESTPQNPVRKMYEQGKILVLVGSERHFGYRIGDVAEITILVLADDSVRLNFQALERGVLGFDGSDFELAGPPSIRIMGKEDGKTLLRIDLKVRSFVVEAGIVFTADIQYSLNDSRDGKAPRWQVLTSPGFLVSTSNTADNGTDLLEGDLSERQPRISWFTYPLLLAGLALLLLWPALLFLRWYRRVRPPRHVSPEERAWLVFSRVIKVAKASGWTARHYKQVAAALRAYLGVEPATLDEALERLKNRPDLPTIKSALRKCEIVLYAKKPLTDAENEELVCELEKLVPRP